MTGKEDEIVLKLLHTADWHLGRRFRSFSEHGAVKLSRARLEVLDRVFLEAERNQVHAILCAGDLFDEPRPPREWADELAVSLKKHVPPHRPVFLLPGNHDAALPDSIWFDARFRQALPAHVHVVEKAQEYELANGCVLFAVPCVSRAGQKDPTTSIPVRAAGDERVRIGMVHGSTFDAPDAAVNFPIAVDAAVTRGLDYLAIGDTHGFRFVPHDRMQPPTVYPGTPEPTAFDEKEPGHVAVVFINRNRRALVQQQRVAAWRWEAQHVTSLVELKRLATRTDLRGVVLRLEIDMVLSAPELEEAEKVLEALGGTDARQALVGVLELDRQKLQLDVAVDGWAKSLPAVLQATVATLKQRAADPAERLVAQRALFHLYRATRSAS